MFRPLANRIASAVLWHFSRYQRLSVTDHGCSTRSPRKARQRMRQDYALTVDFSWVKRDSQGRPVRPTYLTDHTKSPEDIVASLSDFDKRRMSEIGDQIDIQVALGKQRVPDRSKMTSIDWLNLLSCTSNSSLAKKLFYVSDKQLSVASEAERKATKTSGRSIREDDVNDHFPISSIHCRIEYPEVRTFYNMRLFHEYEFCPSIIFDMSFHHLMSFKAVTDLNRQLQTIFHANRELRKPFQLHFCNLRRDTEQYYHMSRQLGDSHAQEDGADSRRHFEDKYPYVFTDSCYTSLFPRNDLIYMSPDARHEMQEFDPTKVYIIGGLVDLTGNEVGVTRSRASSQGIRSLRLPRSVCAQSLPLNVFFDLMREIRDSGDWTVARAQLPRMMHVEHIKRRAVQLQSQLLQ